MEQTQMNAFQVNNTLVNISNIYRQCQNLMHLHIQNKQLQIIEQIPSDSTIETDLNFMLTIIRNLLHNAIKASPQMGIIKVNYDAGKACLKITNQGSAFTQQHYLDALKKSETSHLLISGLGLQIVDELSRKINLSIAYTTNEDQTETCCTLSFTNQSTTL